MSKKKTIECHDCVKEIKIIDKFEDIEIEELKHCPICGGDNIEVTEVE